MKRFIGILLIGVMVLISFMGCANAEFEVSSITVTPSTIVAGESIVVEASFSNVGGSEGLYTANLTLDGELQDIKNVLVASGATEKVSFTCRVEDAGIHTIGLAGLKTQVTALKPAEFKISTLSIIPAKVLTGQEATIKIDVSNIGEVEGTYTATLNVNGIKTDAKEVKLAGGKTDTVIFNLMNEISGSYNIEVGGMVGTLKVLKPAEFEVVSLSVPSEMVEGETIVVTAYVTNVGDVEGTYSGNLSFDDSEIFTSSVTIAPARTSKIYFECSGLTPGIKRTEFNGESKTLKVFTPIEIANDAYLATSKQKSGQIDFNLTQKITEDEGVDVLYEMIMNMDFAFDIDAGQMKMIMYITEEETTNAEDLQPRPATTTTISIYITDGKLYIKTDAPGTSREWFYTDLTNALWNSMQQFMVIQSQMEAIKNAEVNLHVVEEIDGADCYMFEVIPSKEDFLAAMLTQQMNIGQTMDLEVIQMLMDSMEMSMTQWVTKETHIPAKTLMSMYIDMSEVGEGQMTMDIESNISNYNLPFTVELPGQAKVAEYIDLPMIDLPR
jgi:hypothetical protein